MSDKEFTFDKFMDNILLSENTKRTHDASESEEPPIAKYKKKRRENIGNLIKFNGGTNK